MHLPVYWHVVALWWLASVYAYLHVCRSQNGPARQVPKRSCEVFVDLFSKDRPSQDRFGTTKVQQFRMPWRPCDQHFGSRQASRFLDLSARCAQFSSVRRLQTRSIYSNGQHQTTKQNLGAAALPPTSRTAG